MKKRNKRYRPKPVRGNMFVAGYRILYPLEAILQRMEIDGTIESTSDGRAVFDDGEEVYEVVPALNGLIHWLELCANQAGSKVDLSPLSQLKNQLNYQMPITEVVFTACKRLMPTLRRLVSLMPADLAQSNMRTVQISSYMPTEPRN
jgi:hypothetical protein